MTQDTPLTPEDSHILAAEYVLGLLEGAPRRTASERLENDAEFAAQVSAWEQHFEPMNAAYAPAIPPLHVKKDLMNRLFGTPELKPKGLWHSLKLWRGITAGALAVSLFTMGLFITDRQTAATSEPLIASLQAETGNIRFMAFYEAGTDKIRLSKLDAEKTSEQDFELWLIEADGQPQSLGVIPNSRRSTIDLSQDFIRKINAGDTFAVSIEPLGGSPTGAVTGPVIAAGVSDVL
ncbi:anti-sigma factor [Hellea balneolensis]|uniref:anti-sigma factor n=1 Tax=Hellea balneolensis TaxID=287478 RepID=UPI000687C8C3|nr:anti-sigma factor [Hellea balneolensis]